MKTERLYQSNVYQKECESTVLDIITDSDTMRRLGSTAQPNTFCIVLDRTIFFPQGGGQPSDTGFLDTYPVAFVFEREGTIYHQLAVPGANLANFSFNALTSLVGKTIHGQLDWNRRFLHMQSHCGEHILSGVFYAQFGGINRGFHMNEDYMTIDISLEKLPQFTAFTPEMIEQAELLTNEIIWKNIPVVTDYFETKEQASALPLRKPLTVERDISVVRIGSAENPADAVACCGTHPNTTGQVGLVKIVKSEIYKGMTRFTIKAGRSAYKDYTKKHDIISTLCSQYSAEPTDLIEKIKIRDAKNGMIRKALYELKSSVIADALKELAQTYSSLSGEGKALTIITRFYEHLNLDDLQDLGRRATPFIKGLLFLVSPKDNTVMLFSGGTPDCGKLVRDNAPIYQGKGGGNATCARAIFTKQENLDTYMELIEKHLR